MDTLTTEQFADEVRRRSPEPLTDECVAALQTHYRLLHQWNAKISLVGPGTLSNAIDAHYGEALAALPLLPVSSEAASTVVDVGSGAGFPGFVLAAARPRFNTVLVEARQRKWAFLKTAIATSRIDAECILGTIDRSLPVGFPLQVDWLTLRALKLPATAWRLLTSRLAPGGRVLVWAGREEPVIPKDLLRVARTVSLPGSHSKRILELERV